MTAADPGPDERTAAALAAELTARVVDETVTWVQGTGTHVGACLRRAVEGEPPYTADDLARDAADQWARNLRYLTGLARIAAPPPSAPPPSGRPSDPPSDPPSERPGG